MGIWVVVLEAVAGQDRTAIRPDDLDALANALAPNYPHVTGGPSFFQAQFWVEEATASAALMLAQRLWQSAVREVGLPPWDVVRAEARDAHAIEAGLIDWTPETGEDEFEAEPEDVGADAGPDVEEEAELEEAELEEAELEEAELEEDEAEEPAAVATGDFDLGDELEEERALPALRPHLRAAAEKRAAARRAAREESARKRAKGGKAAPKKLGAKKLGAKKVGAEESTAERSAAKKSVAKKPGGRGLGTRRDLHRR